MSRVVQDKVTITPDVDIVASQTPAMRTTLWQEIEHGTTHIVLNLQYVEMVDSSGLGLLISAQNALQERGGRLTITHVSTDLLRLFRLMRLDTHFDITARTDA